MYAYYITPSNTLAFRKYLPETGWDTVTRSSTPSPAAPAPFDPTAPESSSTTYRNSAAQGTSVTVSEKVQDCHGNFVRTLVNGSSQGLSSQTVAWDGKDDAGNTVLPGGYTVVVTSTEEPLVTLLDAQLERQTTFTTADAPMGVAFAADGRTALVANHGAGRITVVDLEAGAPVRDFAAGGGVETLAFY